MAETALYEQIQKIRAQYPSSLSAVMPALQLAQVEHGGSRPQAFREVADALELTPAYCVSIASFYDMFRLRARRGDARRGVHEHLLRARRGAAGRRRPRARARSAGRRDLGRRPLHAAGRRVHRRLRLGDGRRGQQPPPPARQGRGRPGARRRAARRDGARSRWQTAEFVFAGTNGGASPTSREYEAGGRLQGARQGTGDGTGRRDRGAERLAAPRPRRRLLPDRAQVELPARSRSSCRSRTTSSSTPTSPSRERSRTARSCFASPSASSRAA